jgi:hypothetical protein
VRARFLAEHDAKEVHLAGLPPDVSAAYHTILAAVPALVARAGAPTIDVTSCDRCPAAAPGYCRLSGAIRVPPPGELTPAGCPLRGGPVALSLQDRGSP